MSYLDELDVTDEVEVGAAVELPELEDAVELNMLGIPMDGTEMAGMLILRGSLVSSPSLLSPKRPVPSLTKYSENSHEAINRKLTRDLARKDSRLVGIIQFSGIIESTGMFTHSLFAATHHEALHA